MSFLYMKISKENPKLCKKDILKKMCVEYEPSLTAQSFKDECDIGKILKRAQITGSMDHLTKHGGSYGDYVGFDFHASQTKLAEGIQVFSELPSEVRREFGESAGAFFEFVNRPENVGKLEQLLPEIAEPGSYFPDMSSRTPPGATLEPEERKANAVEAVEVAVEAKEVKKE